MKAASEPRFDTGTLRELAGGKAYARGEDYHQNGNVAILSIEPKRVLAQVSGTEDYRTELTGRGKHIGGSCSCRAFEDWGFCKHMVAVALTANATDGDAEAGETDVLGRIRHHLRQQSVDKLVDMIIGLAEHDATLLRRLDLAAAPSFGDDKTLEARLRKAVNAATRTNGFVDYHAVDSWTANVHSALDAVAALASGDRAAVALRLAEHALEQIDQAIEDIDDSDGESTELLNRACEIHLAAAIAARPEPTSFAAELFAREIEDEYGTFDGAAGMYAEVLGEEGLAAYRRLAEEAWAKLPARSREPRTAVETSDFRRLIPILDFFAERDGDIEARIALRAKNLSSQWDYLQLAEFCHTHGRDQEALKRAEEALWLFEDDQLDRRLVILTAELLATAGRTQDAQTHLWRAFEKEPSLDLYSRLRKLGGTAARQRAIGCLEAQLAKKQPSQWHQSAELLVQILMDEKMLDAAWAAVRAHGVSMDKKAALARASEATHPQAAIEVYTQKVEALAKAGGNHAYEEAVQLIARMATLRGSSEQVAYVADFRLRHGRKRNLMKLFG